MSTFFAALLVAHVGFGLIGVMASFRVTFLLLSKKFEAYSLKRDSLIAFSSYIISWFTGGWYYWKYYGTEVKPKIVGGDFSWAHLIVMEAKEHVFLFLPFATFCLALLLWLGADTFEKDHLLRKSSVFLSVCITIVAVVIALSGILITGGAR